MSMAVGSGRDLMHRIDNVSTITGSTTTDQSGSFSGSSVLREQYCCFHRRTKIEKILIILVSVLIFLLFIFLILYIVEASDEKTNRSRHRFFGRFFLPHTLSEQTENGPEQCGPHCYSKEESATKTLESVNLSTDPCHDFYQYACRSWSNGSNLLQLREQNLRIITDILSRNGTDDWQPFTMTKALYSSCISTKSTRQIDELTSLLESLRRNTWHEMLAAAIRGLGLKALLSVTAGPDEINNTNNIIYVSPGTVGVDEKLCLSNDTNYSNDYLKYVSETLQIYARLHNATQFNASAKVDGFKRVECAILKVVDPSLNVPHKRMSIVQLEARYDKKTIDWLTLLRMSTGFKNLAYETEVILTHAEYFQELINMLEESIIVHYLEARIILEVGQYAHEELLKVALKYSRASELIVNNRSDYCASFVNDFMGLAVTAQQIYHGYLNISHDSREKVDVMITKLKEVFKEFFDNSTFIDESSRYFIQQKMDDMELFIGYPHWITNEELLTKYYSGLHIDPGIFFNNVVQLYNWTQNQQFNNLFDSNNITKWLPVTTPLDVHYDKTYNTLYLPSSIFQEYLPQLTSDAMLYGSVGVLIAKELVNGVVLYGNGDVTEKVDNAEETQNAVHCFLAQHGEYLEMVNVSDSESYSVHSIIAYSEGLRLAHSAYRRRADSAKEETGVPGLKLYTQEQLFFTSFANFHCGYSSLNEEAFQVTEALRNYMEFAELWKCPKDSRMSSSHKCGLS